MPNNYVSGVKLIKKRNYNALKKVRLMFFGVVLIILVVLFGEILSNLFVYSSLGSLNSIKINKHTMYALSLGEYSDYEEAQSFSRRVSIQGAGGYIYKQNEKFVVLALVYPTKNDCTNVISHLDSGYQTSCVNLQFKKVVIQSKNFSRSEKSQIKTSIKYLNSLYNKLYSLCISLDSNDITSISASNSVTTIKGEALAINTQLLELNNNLHNSTVSKIISSYISVIEILDGLINKLLITQYPNYILKYALCEIVDNSLTLINNL